MQRHLLRGPWRAVAGALALAGVLAGALLMPVPSLADEGRAAVRREVHDRLPGWRIERVDPSWENAYTVVTTCGELELSFQFIRGHGLAPDDAWIHPSDEYARKRLADLSDNFRYLVWYGERRRPDQLSCRDEMARAGERTAPERNFD